MLFYVTKWVTARGILLVEGSKPERRSRSKNYYSYISGLGRRMATMAIGSEAFYTLEEAQANARERFETHRRRTLAEFTQADLYWDLIQKGTSVQVHKKPGVVSKCRPFIDAKRSGKPAGRSGRKG